MTKAIELNIPPALRDELSDLRDSAVLLELAIGGAVARETIQEGKFCDALAQASQNLSDKVARVCRLARIDEPRIICELKKLA